MWPVFRIIIQLDATWKNFNPNSLKFGGRVVLETKLPSFPSVHVPAGSIEADAPVRETRTGASKNIIFSILI